MKLVKVRRKESGLKGWEGRRVQYVKKLKGKQEGGKVQREKVFSFLFVVIQVV